MDTGELLAKPNTSFLEILKDSRVWSSAIGAIAENALERAVFMWKRDLFGFAKETANGVIFTKTNAATDVTNVDNFKLNRQLFRLITIGVNVYGIQWGGKLKNGELQYGLFGSAVTAAAHVAQDLFPSLALPARK